MKRDIITILLAFVSVASQAQTKVNIHGICEPDAKYIGICKNMDGSGGQDSVAVTNGKWEYMKELPADVYTLVFISDVKAKQAKPEDVIAVMADSIPTEIDLTTGTVKGSKASEAMNATWKGLLAPMKSDNQQAAQQAAVLQMRKAVLDNTDSMLPVVFVPMGLYQGLTYSELKKVFRPGVPYENHPAMQEAKAHMSQMQEEYQKERQSQTARAIGNKFTDIAMNDTTGRERRLSEWCGKGRYVLIDKPGQSAVFAMKESRKMMRGSRMFQTTALISGVTEAIPGKLKSFSWKVLNSSAESWFINNCCV